ncbi:NAD-dependent epimerase/dehydratase family protein [Nonomuraea jiangxiensis]|uniref:NAD dependent epimerase/dehydratase family protein n=1 Tax=Nonomuraea jiangxiensis TaxID=633440 RepID=A0A1G8A6N5_9ACTN|nr:NAD(P)-dependent oxidoreductase [Nonomuraea jiangxiensis]SDH16614.1 NAD dependent epimerase/dehydratase family protein [Nonomuraea jiangxiensis]
MTHRILITGAAGRIGTVLRPLLARPGRILRLLDIAPLGPAAPGEEHLRASFTDQDAIDDACRDVDAVVHLGGLAGEGPWERILAANVDGTQRVLEAVRRRGVAKVVLASSIHAAGFLTRGEGLLPPDAPPRPDTFYGVSKAALEALGSLYHSRFGIDVTCLRIGAFRPRPLALPDLAVWLSHADAARLFEACLATRPPAFRILWGISANTRRWWSLAEGEAIGYRPRDDAERFADAIPGAETYDPADPLLHRVGGTFCTVPLGRPLS